MRVAGIRVEGYYTIMLHCKQWLQRVHSTVENDMWRAVISFDLHMGQNLRAVHIHLQI